MYIFIKLTYAISSLHLLLALISIIVGIISQSRSPVWMAHSVSPIWAGIFFAFCGGTGIVCARQKSLYVILCYVALSIVTLIVDYVNIQLLRLGLVNITTDGEAYLKDRKDILVLIAVLVSSLECLICLLSLSVGIRLSYDAANRKFRKKEGAFFVQVLSEKEIVVVSKAPSSKQSGSGPQSIQSFVRTPS
ncbi:unnamed protein product [Adineta steineri]|uniref:Transmembrane protein 196 n=2 Tax=Adineta steineri TaxID=433720 RepID=A0A819U3K0_9BILA|nr:unnamed protein product [Adineta steineri]CAF0821121.1 unnamed protein product [Adineta steineri]CAF0879114.1 unnamed protein product [Adineta steineri]CAF3601971.1 unnamed protein product [Adineta steineri]CAF3675371.1 unnamed protein product [Adineta steineri]